MEKKQLLDVYYDTRKTKEDLELKSKNIMLEDAGDIAPIAEIRKREYENGQYVWWITGELKAYKHFQSVIENLF